VPQPDEAFETCPEVLDVRVAVAPLGRGPACPGTHIIIDAEISGILQELIDAIPPAADQRVELADER
jgi:hypothetical protein